MTLRFSSKRPWALAALGAVMIGAAAPAPASDFYFGKQITIVCSTAGGGAYDTYARLLAKHMGKYIPGNPAFVVQNMPGASGVKAANFIANVAPRDGTVFAGTHSNIPTAPLTTPKATQYDPLRLSWLGSATRELYVGYVMHSAPIRTLEEAKSRQVTMGGTSIGSFGVDMVVVANEFFGTKFKQVLGYKDAIETRLAMERGEVDGTFGTNYASAFKVAQSSWLKEGKAFIITQYGAQRHPALPDVPTFLEFAKDDDQRQAIKFMSARLDHGKPYFGPPDIPRDRLAILRRAFDATMKDPQFVKEIEAAQLEVDGPMTGEELERLVAEEAATSPSIVERLERLITAANVH